MTVGVVAVLSSLGGALLSEAAYRILSSGLLLVMGAYYLLSYATGARDSCCANTVSTHLHEKVTTATDVTTPMLGNTQAQPVRQSTGSFTAEDMTTAASLIAMTTLTPCVGSMPVLLTLVAPPAGVTRVLTSAAVLLVSSAATMTALVAATHAGASRLDFGRVRRHERLVLGAGLVVLAAVTFAVLASHDGAHAHHHKNALASQNVLVAAAPTQYKAHHRRHDHHGGHHDHP
jgi:hypothetical protein